MAGDSITLEWNGQGDFIVHLDQRELCALEVERQVLNNFVSILAGPDPQWSWSVGLTICHPTQSFCSLVENIFKCGTFD